MLLHGLIVPHTQKASEEGSTSLTQVYPLIDLQCSQEVVQEKKSSSWSKPQHWVFMLFLILLLSLRQFLRRSQPCPCCISRWFCISWSCLFNAWFSRCSCSTKSCSIARCNPSTSNAGLTALSIGPSVCLADVVWDGHASTHFLFSHPHLLEVDCLVPSAHQFLPSLKAILASLMEC